MRSAEQIIIPAGHGHAFELPARATLTVSLIDGPQVVDAWAYCLPDLDEFMSCEHTRSCLEKLCPKEGDAFFSNRRRPLLTILRDTSPGTHDLLLSACDAERYALLGHEGPHRNCADNLRGALADVGLVPPELPSPVNLFENVKIDDQGRLEIRPPVARKGDAITLFAVQDLIVALSACPMDIAPTNGPDKTPKPVSATISFSAE